MREVMSMIMTEDRSEKFCQRKRETRRNEAIAAWYGSNKRAITKRRKNKTKKMGELMPPEEKISRRTTEISMTVSNIKMLPSLRKRYLEPK